MENVAGRLHRSGDLYGLDVLWMFSTSNSRPKGWKSLAPACSYLVMDAGYAASRKGGTTMRRWILVGVLCLSVAAPGAVFSATAVASSTPMPHRCDGDHDRDDVGCPPVRVRVAPMPTPVVVRPRVTG